MEWHAFIAISIKLRHLSLITVFLKQHKTTLSAKTSVINDYFLVAILTALLSH